jgi:hypothetical protein
MMSWIVSFASSPLISGFETNTRFSTRLLFKLLN